MNGKKSLAITSQIIIDMPSQTTASETVISQRKEEIIKEAKRIEEASLYSSKGHLSAAAFWRGLHFSLGLPTTILAAIAAASAFAQFDSGHTVRGWISICVATLSGLSTFLNPNEKGSLPFCCGATILTHSKARLVFFGQLIVGVMTPIKFSPTD